MLTQVFWGLVKTMILGALYAGSSALQPLTLSQAITFIWLSQSALTLLPWDADPEIEELIQNGNVSYALTQPLDLYWNWFFRSFSYRGIPTVMQSIPMLLTAKLFFGLSSPISWEAGVTFACSLGLAMLLSAAMTTIVAISYFWTISGEGIKRLLPHFTLLFSGMIFPLPLFPDWMQPFLNVQPLRGLIDIPSRIYTGIIPQKEVIFYFGLQLLWFLVFVAWGRWLVKRALRRIEIQGG
jgi:ABC-2 type transport system permease protein